MTRRALLVVALVLAFTGTAQAAPVAWLSFTTPMREAQSAAMQYWRGIPCHGQVRIVYRDFLGFGFRGWALSARTSALTTTVPDVYQNCVIALNHSQWPPSAQAHDFPDFCGLMVHEYGHLFGHWDDPRHDRPTSITYPIIGPRNERVRPCVERYGLFPSARATRPNS